MVRVVMARHEPAPRRRRPWHAQKPFVREPGDLHRRPHQSWPGPRRIKESAQMFDRIISVDWSGAGKDEDPVDIRIATFDAASNRECIVRRPRGSRTAVRWSRQAFRDWISIQLEDKRPALIAMDFGFGLPWGSDQSVFEVTGWHEMVRSIGKKYSEHGTARATAMSINNDKRFGGHGPYRFDQDRNDFRFYTNNGVSYYRYTELIAPQAISQWYLGSGGTVGFHTISGLSTLNYLIREREASRLDFLVWPHEVFVPDGKKHVLVESYPAICQQPTEHGPCCDQHERDAWKVLQMLRVKRNEGALSNLFHIKEQPFGRIKGTTFSEQIQFEGFILGIT
jgi:hypothetical protein